MISKYMSHYYFNNKTNLAKYLCKIAFNYYSQELNYNKTKSKEINNTLPSETVFNINCFSP